ncbi:MAG TPA: sigma-70 family RNA polymerase sigma factor [Candidatus Limnocylindrales bacterium]|nr:sigma-70 family RNA polymerase sigma factor [Candidatus Limnocylindrales bacterium]
MFERSPDSDAELLRQVIDEGSQDAFARLYDRYGGIVYSAAMRAGANASTAEEVVQETFLTLWDRAEQFDGSRGALAAWLATIARNRAIDHGRAAARHDRALPFSSAGVPEFDDAAAAEWLTMAGSPIAIGAAEAEPEDALVELETRASIRAALGTIGPRDRRLIALAYQGGLSQSEIAAELDWPLGTVKTRTRRALRQLREALEAAEPSPAE